MLNSNTQLRLIALKISNLLKKYVAIHNIVFKFSWRRIIYLPFIFEAIDFNNLCNQVKQILSELETYNQQINRLIENTTQKENLFARSLLKYCIALMETISLLKELLYQLYLKSKKLNKYNLNKYNKQYNLYKDSIGKYIGIGEQLSELYQGLWGQ